MRKNKHWQYQKKQGCDFCGEDKESDHISGSLTQICGDCAIEHDLRLCVKCGDYEDVARLATDNGEEWYHAICP